jgi:hypothetical protein
LKGDRKLCNQATLQRINSLFGKYGYTSRKTTEARLDKGLRKAKASPSLIHTIQNFIPLFTTIQNIGQQHLVHT